MKKYSLDFWLENNYPVKVALQLLLCNFWYVHFWKQTVKVERPKWVSVWYVRKHRVAFIRSSQRWFLSHQSRVLLLPKLKEICSEQLTKRRIKSKSWCFLKVFECFLQDLRVFFPDSSHKNYGNSRNKHVKSGVSISRKKHPWNRRVLNGYQRSPNHPCMH